MEVECIDKVVRNFSIIVYDYADDPKSPLDALRCDECSDEFGSLTPRGLWNKLVNHVCKS